MNVAAAALRDAHPSMEDYSRRLARHRPDMVRLARLLQRRYRRGRADGTFWGGTLLARMATVEGAVWRLVARRALRQWRAAAAGLPPHLWGVVDAAGLRAELERRTTVLEAMNRCYETDLGKCKVLLKGRADVGDLPSFDLRKVLAETVSDSGERRARFLQAARDSCERKKQYGVRNPTVLEISRDAELVVRPCRACRGVATAAWRHSVKIEDALLSEARHRAVEAALARAARELHGLRGVRMELEARAETAEAKVAPLKAAAEKRLEENQTLHEARNKADRRLEASARELALAKLSSVEVEGLRLTEATRIAELEVDVDVSDAQLRVAKAQKQQADAERRALVLDREAKGSAADRAVALRRALGRARAVAEGASALAARRADAATAASATCRRARAAFVASIRLRKALLVVRFVARTRLLAEGRRRRSGGDRAASLEHAATGAFRAARAALKSARAAGDAGMAAARAARAATEAYLGTPEIKIVYKPPPRPQAFAMACQTDPGPPPPQRTSRSALTDMRGGDVRNLERLRDAAREELRRETMKRRAAEDDRDALRRGWQETERELGIVRRQKELAAVLADRLRDELGQVRDVHKAGVRRVLEEQKRVRDALSKNTNHREESLWFLAAAQRRVAADAAALGAEARAVAAEAAVALDGVLAMHEDGAESAAPVEEDPEARRARLRATFRKVFLDVAALKALDTLKDEKLGLDRDPQKILLKCAKTRGHVRRAADAAKKDAARCRRAVGRLDRRVADLKNRAEKAEAARLAQAELLDKAVAQSTAAANAENARNFDRALAAEAVALTFKNELGDVQRQLDAPAETSSGGVPAALYRSKCTEAAKSESALDADRAAFKALRAEAVRAAAGGPQRDLAAAERLVAKRDEALAELTRTLELEAVKREGVDDRVVSLEADLARASRDGADARRDFARRLGNALRAHAAADAACGAWRAEAGRRVFAEGFAFPSPAPAPEAPAPAPPSVVEAPAPAPADEAPAPAPATAPEPEAVEVAREPIEAFIEAFAEAAPEPHAAAEAEPETSGAVEAAGPELEEPEDPVAEPEAAASEPETDPEPSTESVPELPANDASQVPEAQPEAEPPAPAAAPAPAGDPAFDSVGEPRDLGDGDWLVRLTHSGAV